MNNEDGISPVEKIIIRMAENKQPLRVGGLHFIHPIYEAVIAVFHKTIPEAKVAQRFAKDEEGLRATIVAECLLGRVQKKDQSRVIETYARGASVEEIIDQSAMSIAEQKRCVDGKVLISVGDMVGSDRDYLQALKDADPSEVYVLASKRNWMNSGNKLVKKQRVYKAMALTALIGTLAVGTGLYCHQLYKQHYAPKSGPALEMKGK